MTVADNLHAQSGSLTKQTIAKRLPKKDKNKSKLKPKRPLSAYNFFFREEREKILQILNSESKTQSSPDAEEFLTREQIERLRKDGNKVSFEEMGKLIGILWRNIDPDRLSHFSELACQDSDRYKKEMAAFNSRQENKLRGEASRYPYHASTDNSVGQCYPEHTGAQLPVAAQGYGYGAMTLNGYAMPMPMYNYAPYMAGAANLKAMSSAGFPSQHAVFHQPYGIGIIEPGNMGQPDHQESYDHIGENQDDSLSKPDYGAWGH